MMILLQGPDGVTILSQRGNAQGSGFGTANGGHNRRAGIDSSRANFHFIPARRLTRWGVDDELDLAILEQVQGIRAPLSQLEDAPHFQTGFFQHRRRSAGRYELETELRKQLSKFRDLLLMGIADANENIAARRKRAAVRWIGRLSSALRPSMPAIEPRPKIAM